MIFAILTLLSALSLAAVAGWFSIIGFTTIYAGAPMYAIIMGVVAECAKLVTTSWLYRNWEYATWKLKLPLIYFTIALMAITSIGVFGFLSQAHIQQNTSTIDNSAKIERLNYQIDKEKALIADSEKVIAQLDATVNSFLGKDNAERSLAVRRSQAAQRKQLREEIAAAQKRIDQFSSEKFELESEVRKLQLEVGPIRYIAEMIYGTEADSLTIIESAVKMFTLLIVSTLDPLAVVLLIAANHTIMRLRSGQSLPEPPRTNWSERIQNFRQKIVKDPPKQDIQEQDVPAEEKNIEIKADDKDDFDISKHPYLFTIPKTRKPPGIQPCPPVVYAGPQEPYQSGETKINLDPEDQRLIPEILQQNTIVLEDNSNNKDDNKKTKIKDNKIPWAHQNEVLREIIGNDPHFIPKKVVDQPLVKSDLNNRPVVDQTNKYFKAKSWLTTFGRTNNGK